MLPVTFHYVVGVIQAVRQFGQGKHTWPCCLFLHKIQVGVTALCIIFYIE